MSSEDFSLTWKKYKILQDLDSVGGGDNRGV